MAMAIAKVDLQGEPAWWPLTPPIALGLVRHPDGIEGHWMREGRVRLAGEERERRERGELLDSGIAGVQAKGDQAPSFLAGPSSGSTNPSKTASPEVVLLSPDQLEPVDVSISDVDPAVEIRRSEAYKELRKKLEDEGLFTPPGTLKGYGSDIIRCSVLAGLAIGLHLK